MQVRLFSCVQTLDFPCVGNEIEPPTHPRVTCRHPVFMRGGAARVLSFTLLAFAAGWNASAQDSQPTEYQIKAAFIFNFAKFVEWPKSTFPETNSPLVIGVVGEDPFHGVLEKTVRGKAVDDHPLVVKAFQTSAEATNCHILFISTSEKERLPQVLKDLSGSSVLTVGEMGGFNEAGGMIVFVLERTMIRFKINNAAATSAGLKISSKLLSLAQR